MKYLYRLFILAFLFSQQIYGQFWENNYLYGNIGITGGNYFGANVGANLIFNEKYFINVGILSLQTESNEKPNGYSAGSGILGSGDSDIMDRYNTPFVTAGYVLKLSSKFRVIFDGGLGLQFRHYATDFKVHESNGTFGGFDYGSSPSHDFEWKDDVSAAFIINPRLEFLLSHIYGVGISPLFILNKNETFIGIGIHNIIGSIRKRAIITDE